MAASSLLHMHQSLSNSATLSKALSIDVIDVFAASSVDTETPEITSAPINSSFEDEKPILSVPTLAGQFDQYLLVHLQL